jgi:hypothetical protein
MGNGNEPLSGFSSSILKYAPEISMWSDVFLHDDLAIVLMEAQGSFLEMDGESVRVCTLSSLISSHLLFKLNKGEEADQSKYLKVSDSIFMPIYL